MKLVFPNGEHGQVLLNAGVNRVGTLSEGSVVLTEPGIAPLHCEIHVTSTGANVQVPAGGGPVTVNGKPVSDIMALRSGDQLGLGQVMAKFVVVEAARSAPGPGIVPGSDEDPGATRVRLAVPKYVLRGVSGAVFGKVFPVAGPVVIGRATECDIPVQADEISRRHALVKPTPDGLSVEDLGSANGTYVNARRVQQGFLSPGDELRLDSVRFIVLAPGLDMAHQTGRLAAAAPESPVPAASSGISKWVPIMLTAAAVLVIVALVLGR